MASSPAHIEPAAGTDEEARGVEGDEGAEGLGNELLGETDDVDFGAEGFVRGDGGEAVAGVLRVDDVCMNIIIE